MIINDHHNLLMKINVYYNVQKLVIFTNILIDGHFGDGHFGNAHYGERIQ